MCTLVGTRSIKCCSLFLLVFLAALPGRAASISIVLDPGSPSGPGPFTWTYNATLPNGFQLQPSPAPCPSPPAPGGASCDGLITIYDFAGYLPGTEFSPDGWSFIGALTGPTPQGIVPGNNVASVDNPLIMNLAWLFVGEAPGDIREADGFDIPLGPFGAMSLYNVKSASEYSTRSNSLALVNGRATSSDVTLVPAVPEPASLVLLGSGLLGLGLIVRRRSPRR